MANPIGELKDGSAAGIGTKEMIGRIQKKMMDEKGEDDRD
jgi:hypothetical protein